MGEENLNNVYRGRKKMMFENFLGGIAWSFGTIIGGSILLIVLGLVLSKIDLVPVIGGFLRNITQEAFKEQRTPVLLPVIGKPTPSASPFLSPTLLPSASPITSQPPESTSSAR